MVDISEIFEGLKHLIKQLTAKKSPMFIPEKAIHECKVFECPYCHKVVYIEKNQEI